MSASVQIRRRVRLGIALTTTALLGSILLPFSAARADVPQIDGLTEATAAASCWEIVQRAPGSPSGVYWLSTPALGAPQQFFCDQQTDGGGWVLVGRGREGWSTSHVGNGTPAQVRDVVTGTAAFSPRQLSGDVIDALNDDRPLSTLPDGIRLRRAADAAGTTWQETTFRLASPRDEWTWQFDNQQRVASYTIAGRTGTGGTTTGFGLNDDWLRVRTYTGAHEGWAVGWGYGVGVLGSPAADSYLWSRATAVGYARPFTQVYLRPKITSDGLWPSIPAEGTPARTGPAVAESFALPQPWSVTGLGAGPRTREGSNEVSAFAETDGDVFVGGNFTHVQRDAAGAGQVAQAYLGSFDRATGEWNPGFRPVFDNQVKALAALPGGRVAVGGFFGTVNGESHPGLVVLNAETGAIDRAFTGRLRNALSSAAPYVRALDVQDGWLYVGGAFTHSVSDGGRQTYTRNIARFAVDTGRADAWNPELNGSVMSLDASARGDRVYAAGFFTTSKGAPAHRAAILSSGADAALTPWTPTFSAADPRTYQQAVLEVGDRFWLGGAEHLVASYDRGTLQTLSSAIAIPGGDFQALASDGSAVYAGCHCFGTVYEGSKTWPSPGTGWSGAHSIYASGAWSARTGEYLPQFSGILNTRAGGGAWALFVDSAGTLWQGGDFSHSTRSGFVRQWTSGFVRQRASDTIAPSTPTDAVAAVTATGTRLSWSAATDDRGVTGYQVFRGDRPIATTTATSLDVPAPASGSGAGTPFAVRAVDAAGNLSAGTRPFAAPVPPEGERLVASGATWSYRWAPGEPPAGWTTPAFDDTGWATGAAPFGWGAADVVTALPRTEPAPATSHYRTTMTVTGGTTGLRLAARVDDGIVVYVNGTEVLRRNLPAGPVTAATYATTAVTAEGAAAAPVVLDLPAAALVAGRNTIAVEVHSNYRGAKSHVFDLSVVRP